MSFDAVGGRWHVAVWVLMLGAFSLAIGAVRLLPASAVALPTVVLTAQALWWPAQFTQNSWPVYFGLALVIAGLAAHTSGRLRTVALAVSGVWVFAVTALLTIPGSQSLVFPRSLDAGPGTVLRNYFAVLAVATVLGSIAWGGGALLRRIRDRPVLEPANPAKGVESLSDRENEVFRLAAQSLSNAEIARGAFISETTVKSHMTRILAKLELNSRAQLVAFAWRNGLVADEEVAPS
jgi:DNA-binding CsgD family transcriptional regulator